MKQKKHMLKKICACVLVVIMTLASTPVLSLFGADFSAWSELTTTRASAFSARTTMPTSDNVYYYSGNPFYKSGYGLPNCTCYAFGRAWEVTGQYPKLSTGNAGDWYGYNKTHNYYAYGSTPRAGAIACWSGHVAFVESVNSDGTINFSESNWSGRTYPERRFRYQTNKNPYSYTSGFQGYIYVVSDTTVPTDPWIWSNKRAVDVGEQVSFNFNANGARWYVVGIWHNGQFTAVENGDSDWYTTAFSEPGTYDVHVAIYNYAGYVDTGSIVITVLESNPSCTLKNTVTYNNNKYEYYLCNISWANAKKIAESKGGHLATITSAEEQNIIANNNVIGACWLGATDVDSEGTWKWVTGETWNYTYWDTGEPNNYDYTEDYLGLNSENKWNDYNNIDSAIKGFIIEYENAVPVLKKTITYNNNKYEYYLCNTSWSNAKSIAESKGGHLATITSAEEQSIIASSNVIGACWLGATDSETEGTWKWITGEPWSYTNWKAGEPNDGNDGEDYLGLYELNQWNDFGECSATIKGFIVEYENVNPVLKKTITYHGNRYEYYLCSASWTDAKSIAESKGGHLATITSAEEQSIIASNNVIGACWLGATDSETEGTWKWITDEPWDYTDWNTDEPNDENGGEDYLGFNESNKWNDFRNNTGTIKGFIIEYEHVHQLVSADYFAPTCTNPGTISGSYCELCGEIIKEPEEIPALGHKEETIKGKNATCTEKGMSDGVKCSVCGEIIKTQEEIPALGHSEVTVNGKNATCTEKGLTDGIKCSVCGEIIKAQEEIPALGHTFDKGVCTVCGAIDPDYKVVLNSLNEQIKVDNESRSVVMYPAKTSGMKVSEFKKQFDGEIDIDIDDNSLVANGTKFKFGDNEFTVIVKGDVQADGKITASDARMVLRIAARLESVDTDAFSAADINGDGKVSPSEARKVLRFVARLETSIA